MSMDTRSRDKPLMGGASIFPPKAWVRRSFERAAHTYDGAAKAQRWVCARLVSGLPSTLVSAVILDAGCGTGFGMEILGQRFPAARRIALDFSPAMLARIANLEFGVAGDVEKLPLCNEVVGLYWSNLTVQWCDIFAMCREARRVLWPGGMIAFSSLAPGTFYELEESFAKIDRYRHTLPFRPLETVRQALEVAGFQEIRLQIEPCVAHYRDLKSMMGAIKSIGANQIGPARRPGLMGRNAWNKLEAEYEKRRTPRGLPLTYQVVLGYARK
ncbi:MAG: malonyl-ACP O-methyltransferase BioC [Zoogloeaceae bacterium]|jgi:malonyl-CoA O-methyltransferase|nr:malonyl-ACP O-methyltransferase BioC [Zoogloeaceae bacterium]